MRSFSLYAILLVILITACEKESRMPIPYDGDKVVLNSIIQPDSLIYIRVTKSKPVKEYGNLRFPELQNAVVVMQENGKTLPTPQWTMINGKGYYVSQGVAKAGMQYTLSVSYTGLASVAAADSTPAGPDVRDPSVQKAANRVRFFLKDNIAEKNYYRIRVYNADTVNGAIVPLKRDTVKFRLDPSYNNNFVDIIGNSYYSEVLLTDERISGKDVLFVLQTSKEITASHMIVEVSGLTRGAYKYLDASYTQRLEERVDFTSDPVSIYSNVENGYGIVAGVNARRLSFSVE